MSTIAEKIMEQDSEAFKVLNQMLETPAMYFGAGARFDHVIHFFEGYRWGRRSFDFDFMPNRELQFWLLHTHSASFHASNILGLSLFFRCFGIGKIAFEQYKLFLNSSFLECEATMPSNEDLSAVNPAFHDKWGVNFELYAYEERNNMVRYDFLKDGIPKDNLLFVKAAVKSIEKYGDVRFDWADDVSCDHHKNLAKDLINHIENLIRNSNYSYDKLKIYVRKERIFTQVRFLFHNSDGWNDDYDIIKKPDNHETLIAIHANAINASTEAMRECGCDVFDMEDYVFKFVPDASVYVDEMAFYSEYLRWRSEII